MTNSPIIRYNIALQREEVFRDESQRLAVDALDALWQQITARELARNASLLTRLKRWLKGDKPGVIQGLYLWGGVGRGKTWLMDMFYDSLPLDRKMRTHFHRFMRRIHAELKHVSREKNPLEKVAARIAGEAEIICFDEFFVADITDAMILANLLEAMLARGVLLVATSNVEPQELYKDGLQRSRFLPALALLQANTRIVNVDGGIDYRLRALEQADLYHTPVDSESRAALDACFKRLVPDCGAICANVKLEIEGRILVAEYEAEDVVWFDFAQLCDGPRSQNDYIELAREYHAVVVEKVPAFRGGNDDQARRFINLVDEFYDRGVKLVISAEQPIRELYVSGNLGFEFDRTISRILEMQSTEYLARAHQA